MGLPSLSILNPCCMQEPEAKEQLQKTPTVPVDDSQRQCALSGERFQTVWDAESEDWHYLGAVRLSAEEAARCKDAHVISKSTHLVPCCFVRPAAYMMYAGSHPSSVQPHWSC